MESVERPVKKPWWRWLLLPLSPIAIPIGFIIGIALAFREEGRRGLNEQKNNLRHRERRHPKKPIR